MKTNTLVLPSQRTLVDWLLSLVKKRKSKASQFSKHRFNSHRLFLSEQQHNHIPFTDILTAAN
jgi:hypothetical protein